MTFYALVYNIISILNVAEDGFPICLVKTTALKIL